MIPPAHFTAYFLAQEEQWYQKQASALQVKVLRVRREHPKSFMSGASSFQSPYCASWKMIPTV